MSETRTKNRRSPATSTASTGPTEPIRIDNAHRARSLGSMQQILHELTRLQLPESEVMAAFVRAACEFSGSLWCGCFDRSSQGGLALMAQHNAVAQYSLGVAMSSVMPACERSAMDQATVVQQHDSLTVIAVPVLDGQTSRDPRVVCIVANLGDAAAEPFTMLIQVVASHIAQWNQLRRQRQLGWQVETTAAIAELLAALSISDDWEDAQRTSVNRIRDFVGAETVAIGFCNRPGSKQVQLATISGSDDPDLGGPAAKQLRKLLAETLARDEVTSVPDRPGEDRCMKLAHRELSSGEKPRSVVSAPLVTQAGDTIGAWTCVFDRDRVNLDKAAHMVAVASPFLADGLSGAKRANESVLRRAAAAVSKNTKSRRTRIAVAAAAAVLLICCIPIPHRIACVATLEPSAQRFAVVPHDGLLRESFVETGDTVSAGQLLARMDDEELHLQIAEVEAQRQRAIKERDIKRTSRDAGATQIAKLELQRLELQLQLLRQRQDHLNVLSPIDALVLESDVDDVEGMPVRSGDILMRLAPMDQLKLQLAVPEQDIAYILPGQLATVSFDGYAVQPIEAKVDSIRPVSEVREQQNVFVVEAIVNNIDGSLRPGMTGRGKIRHGNRPIGWIMFHHAWEKVYAIVH